MSGLGKGVTCGSIGRILKSRGLGVVNIKLDPYLNVDPGTMNPAQHGEVFVTDDGAETDLDLGHYERFTDVNLTADCNTTSGQVYAEVIRRERWGDFLGGTIQVIPHVTDAIKSRILRQEQTFGAQVLVVEVGGTIGDMEGLPFVEALRQLKRDVGQENIMYIHLTYVPRLGPSGEFKTKPTQHSVATLRSIGILPEVIACRCEQPLGPSTREKIALFCDVDVDAVISLPTLSDIYGLPMHLEEEGLGDYICRHLGIDSGPVDLTEWNAMVERSHQHRSELEIALVGKYVEATDAYMSVVQALYHAGVANSARVKIRWVDSESVECGSVDQVLGGVDGVLVPGGFGVRGLEGKIAAAGWARATGTPYLGLCLGMQMAVVEFARNAAGIAGAVSYEQDSEASEQVISPMPQHHGDIDLGGTMRLGAHPCTIANGTRAAAAYEAGRISERHRHRMEFNNAYRNRLQQAGMVLSGINEDRDLVEIVELADHPWFVGVQFHPEFKSRPNRPHPLFVGFLRACGAQFPITKMQTAYQEDLQLT
jgi:CTP synthase